MLRRAADPRVAAQARSYFKQHETIHVHGVGSPRVRAIERELFEKVSDAWTADDAPRLCQILVTDSFLESKSIGFHLLKRYDGSFDRPLLDAAYGVAASLLGDREDLIHKAAGWLLREAGRTDSPRLETFLLTHGPRVPRTTLRYAIKRMPERKRRRILAATRPG